ncbi:cytoplasmic dynein 2 intermediate chain 1 [Syngnathus scovelli]|uniref:cytoplasmic dynein 2 intermediate chain 1 n=1 Tax=Syngnathus scovelli TaxID=161590 RepID=UPI0021101FB6|nr:cytoplasmic dynein 2 intermediate chain 1 [Syngnathus scovelli]
MHNEKKRSMEDTWSAAELKRLLSRTKEQEKEQEHDRKQHRGGESAERRSRDSRGDRDHRDHHGARRDLYAEERRGDRDRRPERDRLEDTSGRARGSREDRDKRDKWRPRKGHEEEREDALKRKEGKERRKDERDKERRRDERDRRRHQGRRDDQDGRERCDDKKPSREEREQYRKQKEERERRHKEKAYHDEKLRREEGAEEERKRRKERRQIGDAERHHSSSKDSRPSHSRETKTKKAEVAEHEPSPDYEDDFEDYEEDFDELDEDAEEEAEKLELGEEVEAIQKAMGEENERVRVSISTLSKDRGEEKPELPRVKSSDERSSRGSQRGKFIDFVAAKQREVDKKVAMKQKKRSAELLRLMDLDFSTTFSLLDLPPVSEYDMYIRNFGAANTKQAYVQCNEENAERDVQTEEVDLSDKWTQHPAEHSGACGDPKRSHESGNVNGMNLDSRRLAVFLRAASQVMAVLLEEDHTERSSFKGRTTQSDTLSFSDGSLRLNMDLPFLRGRAVSQVLFSQAQRHTLLSVHKPPASPDDAEQHRDCTVICVWNMWEPSRPQKILLCDSEVQCCCFSPGKATLVFSGTSVGSVALWDLREPDGDHQRLKVGGEEWTFRRPTFSTDAVPSAHSLPVTSVEVVATNAGVVFLASEEELLGLSFRLASLDESGLLNLWVVVQLPKGNEAGSQTDLGLRPGGKVKLLHSSACVTAEGASASQLDKPGAPPPQCLHLKFLPTDPSHFFIGTNLGLVSHGTTQGLKALPKRYTSQESATRLVDVSAVHFSPFRPNLFLVGCGDGSVRLHEVSCEKPVDEWTDGTAGEAVVSLQWSQTRPAVFWVLDAASRLHIWDLLKSDKAPVVTERLDADRLTAMAAFGDPGQQNMYSGIATAHRSGKIEMHYFTREFTVQSCEEEQALEAKIVQSL